jgi:putative transposase
MPNHIHFLVRIRDRDELTSYGNSKKQVNGNYTEEELNELASNSFSNLFNSYTKSYNKLLGRKGSLFMPRFKRKVVNSRNYLLTLIKYIHYNPVNAGLSKSLLNWEFSSYRSIVSHGESFINKKEIIGWFEDLENFQFAHGSR